MQAVPLPQEQEGLNLHDYIGILLRYKWLVLCCFVVGLAAGVYMGSGSEQRPEYQASALLKVGKKGPGFLSAGIMEERTFAEEIEITKSRAFLERVARRLKHEIEVLSVTPPKPHQPTWLTSWLSGNAVFAWAALTTGTAVPRVAPVTLRDVQVSEAARSGVYTLVFTDARTFVVSPEGWEQPRTGELERHFPGWGFSFTVTGGPVAAQTRLILRVRTLEEVIATLGKSLVFSPLKETNLLRISTTAHSPDRARESAQTVIEEYMAFGRQQSEQEAAQSLEYMTRQLEIVQNNIEEYLSAVRNFKEQHPLASLAEDIPALISQSASYEIQLRKDLRKVRENMATAQALLTALEGPSDQNTTGSTILNQATILGDAKVLEAVGSLLGLEEEHRTQGAHYFIVDPTTRELESKARRARTRLVQHISALLNMYQKQAEFLQQVIAEFEAKLQVLPELEQGLSRITRRLKVHQDMYSYLVQRREETQIARTTEANYTVVVIDPPYVRAVAQMSKKLRSIAIGLLLGLAGGVGLALLRERLDLSLKSVEEVERTLGLPVFGTIPEFGARKAKPATAPVDPSLIVLFQPQASAAEGYRILRTNIRFAEPDKRLKTLVLSSAMVGEGKSVSVANLAVAISQTGQKTLLVDADMRRPTLHHLFRLEREPGLSDVLIGRTSWQEAVQATAVENLSVLPCGKIPPNPAELLGSARMSQLLAEWQQEYEQILLDSPPLLAVADPALLASKCDQMLLVVRAHRTPAEPVQRALAGLATVHAPVRGVVFNAVDVTKAYRYYYYYRYHYGYGYDGTVDKPHRLVGLRR